MTDLNTTSIAPNLDDKVRADQTMENNGKKFNNITKSPSRLWMYVLYSLLAGKPVKSEKIS
jgi:hypothetical protein